jgi:hypothetical protein
VPDLVQDGSVLRLRLLEAMGAGSRMPIPDQELEGVVRIALETRRRVKEQQKRCLKTEFRNTHFSYFMGVDGLEQFVSTPELHSDEAIESDPLPPGQVLAGVLCGVTYLAFAVALAALAACLVRSTLAATAITLGILLALPIAATFRAVHDWLPSTLVEAPVDLLTGSHLSRYLPTFGVTAAATVAVLALAVARLRAREV